MKINQQFINNISKEILYTYKKHYWPIITRWLIRAKPDVVNVTGCKNCKHLVSESGVYYHCTKNKIVVQHWELENDIILKTCPLLPPRIKAKMAIGKL